MTVKRIRMFLILMSFFLTTISLAFTGGVNIASFQQNYTNSVLSSYHVLANETVNKIEYAVEYGKPLTNFYGIEEMLQEKKDDSRYIEEVYIVLPFGSKIYNEAGPLNENLPDEVQRAVDFNNAADNFQSVATDGSYELFLPIRDRGGEWIGSMGMTLSDEIVTANTQSFITSSVLLLAGFGVLSAIVFSWVLTRTKVVSDAGAINRRRLFTVILSVLGTIQIAYGTFNYTMLQSAYEESVNDISGVVLQVVQNDIEHVVSNGVSYEQIHGLDQYLNNIVSRLPEVDRITVSNQGFSSAFEAGGLVNTAALMPDEHGNDAFTAELVLSGDYINGHMQNMLLDTATIVIVSFVILLEVSLFAYLYVQRRINRRAAVVRNTEGLTDQKDLTEEERSFVRPAGFMIFGAVFISASFIPIYMGDLYEAGFPVTREVFMSLPITIEFFMALMIFLVYQGRTEKQGWKPAFLIGSVLIAAGAFFSWGSWDALSFLLSRVIVGLGFGMAFLGLRTLVTADPDTARARRNVQTLHIGSLSGMYAGIVIGSLVAERIGFHHVFLISAVIAAIGGLFGFRMIRNVSKRKLPRRPVFARQLSKTTTFSFVTNREILITLMFVILPMTVSGMFLFYLFPVFVGGEGVSVADIGRAFLLHGVGILYLGPWLRDQLERVVSSKVIILSAGLVVALSLVVFAFWLNVTAAYVTIVLLGIALSLALHAQLRLFLHHPLAKAIGEQKALNIHSIVERTGQIAGPLIFAVILFMGLQEGLFAIGGIILVMTVIYFVTARDAEVEQGLTEPEQREVNES